MSLVQPNMLIPKCNLMHAGGKTVGVILSGGETQAGTDSTLAFSSKITNAVLG